jgi:cyclic pyranopterin phosphate synthase
MAIDVLSTDRQLVDAHGRVIRYLRISVTDRCDLRCRYCMAEQMTFLPRAKLLSLEEIAIIAERFMARGVTKIRLSGGEPLVRRDVGELMDRLGRHVGHGLDELTMTTNGTRLAEHAERMVAAGIRRINVSLDSLDADTFRFITRHGDLAQVAASPQPRRPGLRSRSTWSRLPGSTRPRSARCSPGAPPRAMTCR